MSNTTNISTVDLSGTNTKQYFNNFNNLPPINFSADQFDAFISFFETTTDNRESAEQLASAIIYTSKQQNIPPMTMLDQFRALRGAELTQAMALFLNYYRFGSSLIGVSTVVQSNQYIKRAVIF